MSDITIYEIAKLADVSPSTVSRVINHKENVNAATKERVEKILREHNFVVNEAARGLVMKQSRMIGILISDLRTTQHTSGVYYMERELTAKGYTCLILNTGRNPEEQKVSIERLSRRNVDAAILMGSVYQNDGGVIAKITFASSSSWFSQRCGHCGGILTQSPSPSSYSFPSM